MDLTALSVSMVPVALAGAAFLALGVQLQSSGVHRVEMRRGQRSRSLSGSHVFALASSGTWLLGTLALGLAVVLQLVSIAYAPLLLVQPLGVVALVITTWWSSRSRGVPLAKPARRAVAVCVGGVACFVGIAAIVSTERAVSQPQLVQVLMVLAAVLALIVLAFPWMTRRRQAMLYVVGAGTLYGIVATLAKVILDRLLHGQFDAGSVVATTGVIVAVALGGYFVQNAYACGSADLVVAGLTVIDPLVAVGIGVTVLHEAAGAPPVAIAGFVLAAVLAVSGVILLARHHPQPAR